MVPNLHGHHVFSTESGHFILYILKQLLHLYFAYSGILDQHAITKFAESFEMIPRTPAENAGLNAMDIISRLYEKHPSGNAKVGVYLAAKGGSGVG
ncbi:hypothetical protein SLEP1_g30799 [Rubroshorea leprosula]|uniref:Uncharacterized protein n=1 Tax=Rubroshorea leprosula TaxID=152421 RepID=A0AAV5KAE6_9ROSI|nr:hypothetical protein SLEP1_g30799 [Rubroshorea leprosula]